jgi:hypothetical protein
MKFSVFYEMQISRPTRALEAQLFRDCLEQVVFADELGYHGVWEVEHHGLYEYSHSSAPTGELDIHRDLRREGDAPLRLGAGRLGGPARGGCPGEPSRYRVRGGSPPKGGP